MQEQFIKVLRTISDDTTSFVEEIASVLDIGYDAAYRRVNLKTNLSLEETVTLARYYKVSLNKLFEIGSQNTIVAEVSPLINTTQELEEWFKSSLANLNPLKRIKGAKFIYSAKDIPVFHSLKDSKLTRFKIYVWLKDGDPSMVKNKVSFEDFLFEMPSSLMERAIALGKAYDEIDIIEIWNDSTIVGSLQQVLFYFESGSLSRKNAIDICKEMDELIDLLEQQTLMQSLSGKNGGASFNLYKSEFHTLNNALMVVTPKGKTFFNAFTVLSYLKIDHQPTCDVIYEFLKKQLASSKQLVNAGERDINIFFKKIHDKINIVRKKIKLERNLKYL
ncbi:MAG: hypothetical protein HKO81_03285 [Flavobacteriaceae bacterium]|nr:hypothetical protein [Bacteroidia bacterium]MBT8268374.1 hypothetical protein [Bacteroidia bacterium]NNL15648.1 hypothetical protein [Flavobacteriaceae bacterium]NNL80289.1 hypothetical protein [Flavobacteriaceae bacterium]